jgi:glutaredoxin
MSSDGAMRTLGLAATVLCCGLGGCTWLSEQLEGDDDSAAEEARPQAEEPTGDALPPRPPSSTARSETGVITFQSVLEDTEMTREQRIRAFQNLDPAALQKPVARANVSGAPSSEAASARKAEAPADWEIANARRRVPVVMYSTAWCGVCKRARAYFEEKRIEFQEHDVDQDAIARAEYERLNPRRSVPTLKIGDEVVVGFSAQAVERALDRAARRRLN